MSLVKIVTLDEIIYNNIHNNKFNRYDIVVRLLAIDNYYKKNDIGFKLYKKMQKNRLKLNDIDCDNYLKNFINLIESINSNGYDKKFPIQCAPNMKLLNGSHRIACCCYFGISNLYVLLNRKQRINSYNLDWFIKQGFDQHELELIENRYIKMLLQIKSLNIFAINIWAPIYNKSVQIMKDLHNYLQICFIKTYNFESRSDYNNKILTIYAADDIDIKKVKNVKLKYFNNYPTYFILCIGIIKFPKYRKKVNNNLISTVVEKCKKEIRGKFKKDIPNYIHDVIIHIADNKNQTIYILNKLFNDF